MTTGTQGWHADPALMSSYLAGDLDAVTGASVEQHVSRCDTCRAAVGQLLEPQLLEQTWTGIRVGVERTTMPYAMRIARRLGLPEPTLLRQHLAEIAVGSDVVGLQANRFRKGRFGFPVATLPVERHAQPAAQRGVRRPERDGVSTC